MQFDCCLLARRLLLVFRFCIGASVIAVLLLLLDQVRGLLLTVVTVFGARVVCIMLFGARSNVFVAALGQVPFACCCFVRGLLCLCCCLEQVKFARCRLVRGLLCL